MTKDGMCRRIAAQLDAHHRRVTKQRDHDTPREVCCSSFAVTLKGGGFQVANSYRVSIVAKLPRGGAGDFRNLGLRPRGGTEDNKRTTTRGNRDGRDGRQQAYDNKGKQGRTGRRTTSGRQQGGNGTGETVDNKRTTARGNRDGWDGKQQAGDHKSIARPTNNPKGEIE